MQTGPVNMPHIQADTVTEENDNAISDLTINHNNARSKSFQMRQPQSRHHNDGSNKIMKDMEYLAGLPQQITTQLRLEH